MRPQGQDLTQTRIIIPVRNGGIRWRQAAAALHRAVPDPTMVVVVDSESTDGSDVVAASYGFVVDRIDVRTFNHGRTRQEAMLRFRGDRPFVVFLTHDAVVEDSKSLTALLAAFDDPSVGAAYGRQLPHPEAQPFGAHGVLFNYPPISVTRSLADATRFGVKTTYISNSFAAYRAIAINEIGGFPDHVILGEDTYVSMRMILAGWRIRYCADARVFHSHDYSIREEMQRYFDFGILHAQVPEIVSRFGEAEGEGARFVSSEARYMFRTAPWLLPEVLLRNAGKYICYRLGRNFVRLPPWLCRRLSMTKVYWDESARLKQKAGH